MISAVVQGACIIIDKIKIYNKLKINDYNYCYNNNNYYYSWCLLSPSRGELAAQAAEGAGEAMGGEESVQCCLQQPQH